MSPLVRGVAIAVVHALLVLALGGWFLYERDTLPRAWVLTAGLDPFLPVRGRYADLRLAIEIRGPQEALEKARRAQNGWTLPRAENGALVGDLLPDEALGDGQNLMYVTEPGHWFLRQPVAFFLSEHEPDPTRLAEGDELWAEVTVPTRGAPRPIRLEVRHAAPKDDAAPAP